MLIMRDSISRAPRSPSRSLNGIHSPNNTRSNYSGSKKSTANSRTLGAFATKQTSEVNNISGNIGKVKQLLEGFLGFTLVLIKKITKKLWKIIKPLPWKIIVPSFFAIILLLFAAFHFYFASPSRITDAIESNYESSQVLEEEIDKTSVFLERIPPYSTDIQEADSTLYNLNQVSQSASIALPPMLFSSYAFRDDADTTDQIENLYSVADKLNISVLQKTSEQTSQLLNISKQFFEKDIEQDTTQYINLLNEISEQLDSLTVNGSELDVSTLQRIFQQILNSAKQYEITKDIENFNLQTNNVSSEVYKVIYQSWSEYASSVQVNLSTYRSSTESIIFSQD
jgi:hypothetical protein